MNFARTDRGMLANDFVDDALVRRERVEALLLNLGPGILGGVQKDVVGDALVVLVVDLAGGHSEDADCEAGVAGSRVGDPIELVIGDDVLVEPPFRASTQEEALNVLSVCCSPLLTGPRRIEGYLSSATSPGDREGTKVFILREMFTIDR